MKTVLDLIIAAESGIRTLDAEPEGERRAFIAFLTLRKPRS